MSKPEERALTERSPGAARWALAALFVLNAQTYANVVPRLPAIKDRLDLSNTALGLALAAWPAGALVSGAVAGWVIHRFGSRRAASSCGVGFGLLLPLFVVVPSWAALVGVFFAFGVLDALMDVSMNSHAVRVQRGLGRPIMNGLHGFWSAGAVSGSLLGTAAIAADVQLSVHLPLAGLLVVAIAAVASRHLLLGADEEDRDDVGERATPEARRALAVLGLVVVMAAIVEDAPSSWGAVLLRDELGAPAVAAGLAHLGFQLAMMTARLGGDRIVGRLGPATTARAGGAAAAVGATAGLLVGSPASVVAGFVVAGLGTGVLFPLVFDAAGQVPGVRTGHGIAVAAWIARLGFLGAAPLIGALADVTSLRIGLGVVPVAAALVVLLAGALRPRAGRLPV